MNLEPAQLVGQVLGAALGAAVAGFIAVRAAVRGIYRRLGRVELILRFGGSDKTPSPYADEPPTNPGVKP